MPSHSVVFFTACAIIAALDLLDAAGYYEEWFSFKETSSLNQNFELYGMTDKNFVLNSGSYFVFQGSVLFFVFGKAAINKLAVANARSKWWRKVGMKNYIPNIK